MTTKFVTEYLDRKIEENEDYIVCTFYDLRVKKFYQKMMWINFWN